MGTSRMGGTESIRGLLSVVIPCFNEEVVIQTTHRRLIESLERIPKLDLEIVYIDDGSRDRTLERLRELQCGDRRVRVIALSRNFGRRGCRHCWSRACHRRCCRSNRRRPCRTLRR